MFNSKLIITFASLNKEIKNNMFDSFFKGVSKIANIKKQDKPFTAEYAWLETTYGHGSYKELNERIKYKVDCIREMIKSKFPSNSEIYRNNNSKSSYRCIVDIEPDLFCCVEEIFKPFKENGFNVINLSDIIEEIEDEHVYLISWKNAFKV